MKTRCAYLMFMGLLLFGCDATKKTAEDNKLQVIEARPLPPIAKGIAPGIPVYKGTTIKYNNRGKSALKIQFGEPVVISVASRPEKWGFFQFPKITNKADGSILAKWHMQPDAITSYGKNDLGAAVSWDGGKTWAPSQDETGVLGGLLLSNGDRIQINTPLPIKIEELTLPEPIGKAMDTYSKTSYTYYKLDELPASRQGVFLSRLRKGDSRWTVEQDALIDPHAARYSYSGLVPVVWWGDMHLTSDGSIFAGVYPGMYIKEDGKVDPKSGVFFYRSQDNGRFWKIQGRIPYVADLAADPKGNERMGFTEPAFEILPDGTFLCVLRTTDGMGHGPMYISRSADQGITWTKPEAITLAGVLPRLLQLSNGVTVLASGRPGVQLRFSTDGNGKTWTEPFEMLPFENDREQVSCGYTELLPTGFNRFLVIYSDFKYPNENNELRKAIKVREVTVSSRAK